LTTKKNLFITNKLYQKIREQAFLKTGINPVYRQYNYYYIIHKVIADLTFHQGAYIGCKMHTSTLSKLFGKSKQDTCGILKDLVSWGLIYISKQAKEKESSACYALTRDYSNDNIIILTAEATDVSFLKKLVDERDEELTFIRILNENIAKLTLNDEGFNYINNRYNISLSTTQFPFHTKEEGVAKETAFKVSKTTNSVGKEPKFFMGGVEIDQIDLPLISIFLGDFNSSRPDSKSRIYNNLTNLKRESRQYIHFNGKPLMMTDISNSQILLSVAAVKNQYSITSGRGLINLPDDVKHYQKLAQAGQFYEYMIEKAGYTGDRNKFKKQFFTDVFFSKITKWSTPIKDVFMVKFPTVYKMICQLKSKDYADFAISMQRLEASIIIDTVAKKMIKAKRCILTLHDAIVTTNEGDLILAEQLITDAMVKYKITPQFKRETKEKYKNREQPEVNSAVHINHYIESFAISNYKELKPITETLTEQETEVLMEKFAIAARGHREVFMDKRQFDIYVRYDEDDNKIINFKNYIKVA
jgi:hypothetical protein